MLQHMGKRKYFYCSSCTVEHGRNSVVVSMMNHADSSGLLNVLG